MTVSSTTVPVVYLLLSYDGRYGIRTRLLPCQGLRLIRPGLLPTELSAFVLLTQSVYQISFCPVFFACFSVFVIFLYSISQCRVKRFAAFLSLRVPVPQVKKAARLMLSGVRLIIAAARLVSLFRQTAERVMAVYLTGGVSFCFSSHFWAEKAEKLHA